MGTTKTTTNTNQYTPQATSAQNTLSNTYGNIVANPFNNPQYAMGLQMQNNASNQLGMNAIQNAMRGYNMAGGGNLTGGARASLLSGLGRQASSYRQQGFFNNWNTAISNQQFGANVLGNLSGQLSGTTQVQKTGGVGTWLPAVASALTGGLLGGFGGGGGAGGGGGDTSGFGAAYASGGAFGAPSIGYSGNGLPGQSFGGTNALFGGPNPSMAAPTPGPYQQF